MALPALLRDNLSIPAVGAPLSPTHLPPTSGAGSFSGSALPNKGGTLKQASAPAPATYSAPTHVPMPTLSRARPANPGYTAGAPAIRVGLPQIASAPGTANAPGLGPAVPRALEPVGPGGFRVAGADIFEIAQRGRARGAAAAAEPLPHEHPPETTDVAKRAGAFAGADVQIDAAARHSGVLDEPHDRALPEPERRAHDAGAAEHRGIAEVGVEADQPAHRRSED